MSLQIETDSEWNPYAEHEQTIESLREQLSVAASEILALRSANKQCVEFFEESQKNLAASQAREMQLRDALVVVNNAGDDEWYLYTPEQAKRAVSETLALPQDTSALGVVIQKAGELMRERCRKVAFGKAYADSMAEDVSNVIRALPGVTLGDLK